VLREEPTAELSHVHAVDAVHADRAALVRPDLRDHVDAVARSEELLRPAVTQIAEARDLAIHPDAARERDRHGDGIVIRGRVSPDLLVLANVAFLLDRAGHERPQGFDLVAPNI